MKVLVLTPGVFDKGGISRYGRFQIRALREEFGDRAVYVLSLMGPDGEGFEDGFNVDWHGSSSPSIFTRASMVYHALGYVISNKPDVVVTGHVNLGPLGWLCARLAGSGLIQNIYGREVWSGLSLLRQRALTFATSVISDCGNTADYVQSKGLTKQRPHVVWDCVDVDRYTPGEPSQDVLKKYGIAKTERFRLLFLGRIMADVRYKGTERLIRLLPKLPDYFECVLAGGGDDIDYLQELSDQLGVGDRVSFPGRIHEEDMPDIYRSADAFYLVSVVGSGMGEGIPLTPIEAMSCGVPVIVGNQDGSKEILVEGGGCCVSPNNNKTQLKYINKVFTDRSFLEKERLRARTRAVDVFSYHRFASKTLQALHDNI